MNAPLDWMDFSADQMTVPTEKEVSVPQVGHPHHRPMQQICWLLSTWEDRCFRRSLGIQTLSVSRLEREAVAGTLVPQFLSFVTMLAEASRIRLP